MLLRTCCTKTVVKIYIYHQITKKSQKKWQTEMKMSNDNKNSTLNEQMCNTNKTKYLIQQTNIA